MEISLINVLLLVLSVVLAFTISHYKNRYESSDSLLRHYQTETERLKEKIPFKKVLIKFKPPVYDPITRKCYDFYYDSSAQQLTLRGANYENLGIFNDVLSCEITEEESQ